MTPQLIGWLMMAPLIATGVLGCAHAVFKANVHFCTGILFGVLLAVFGFGAKMVLQ